MRKQNGILKALIIFAVIVFIVIISIVLWYRGAVYKPINKNDDSPIRVEIKEGMTNKDIASLLEDNNVIKSSLAMRLYMKNNHVDSFKAGKYDFNHSENLVNIIEKLVKGDVANDSVKLTIIEGKNMRWVAKKIAEVTNNSEDDVFELLEDEDYIDGLIEKYWFLTDDIKNADIYYPLEGYLLPDTYVFENKDVTVEYIFNVILNYMEKYLDTYKDDLENSEISMHQILTLASMAELEGKSLEDRKEIVGVFINRINKGMSLGSDVTTYYAFKVDMGDRDLTAKELNTENPYNTRGPNMIGKLPVGPIDNPSKEAIEATLFYTETDALYFVADKNGKVYFTKSNDEHNAKIKELKKEGLWFTY